ncbi:MAG: ABC transporter ATP-binding protein [Clostridia bacterium]|nr:ABC transporter ATP-binding protein [Clostridia bacterium]
MSLFKRFIAYYKPHRALFALDMLASLLISIIGMLYPVVTNYMLNELIPHIQEDYRDVIRKIFIAGALVLLCYILRLLLRYFVQYYGHIIGVRMQAHMRSDMFAHLQKLPFSFYDEHETGKIMSRMTSDLQEVSELAHHGPENLFISGIMIILSFSYLLSIHVPLTLIIFACVPFLVLVSATLRKKMRDAFTERRRANAEINAALESSISGIRVTKAFSGEKTERAKFEKGNGQFVEASRKSYSAMGKFFSSTAFITDVFNVIIIIAGGFFLYREQITFGDYSTFIVSVNLFVSPVNTLVNFSEQFQNGITGFRRFAEIMDAKPEKDREGALPLETVEGNVAFSEVSFSYGEGGEVLHNVSFSVAKGEKLALVGSSGGGKTTICHLLPAFYPLEEGSITVDGRDIRDITKDSLRRHLGIVQQDVFLFGGTIYENILYGRPDATREEVEAAAKMANLDEYIRTLPNGYDTEIGERGVKLSGGQKQRVSIARVFLKNPAILILDEATSALDNTTEMLIQQSLDELCRGRTTFVVAHRLSTVKSADRIAVVDKGRIMEMGTHEELLAQNGIYARLYRLQFREEGEGSEDAAALGTLLL